MTLKLVILSVTTEIIKIMTAQVIPIEKDHEIPQNIKAEQALIAALLINNKALEHVIEFLEAHHFCDATHGKIYQAICTLSDQGKIADPITLSNFFQKDGLPNVGQYLIDLVNNVITIVSVKDYGMLVYDLYLRRELIDIGYQTISEARCYEIEKNATTLIESTEQKLYKLLMSGKSENDVVPFQKALSIAIERAEVAFKKDDHIIGVTTGLKDLDQMLGGLHSSDLIIVAGRPSMGKTALGTNIAFNAAKSAKSGGPIAFFSLEMSSEQLAARILSSESNIPSDYIRRGAIKFDDFPKFLEISKQLSDLKFFIDDTPGLSIVALRNRARRLKRHYGISLIVVDYLQLITLSSRSSDNRVQEVSEITRSLKGIAKELDVPVLALSQLSRAVEQRDDKKPQLSDLRESGTIEQDADVVMFVYRQEYYESRKKPNDEQSQAYQDWMGRMEKCQNQADLLVAKQRHGPIGNVRLHFDGRLTKFSNFMA